MHPLKVYYPYGGKHFLLKTWTHNGQDQIILARHELSLIKVIKSLSLKNNDLQVKEGYEIDIVSPSENLCQRAAELKRKEEVEDFLRDVAYHIAEYLPNQFPEQFIKCDKLDPIYPSDKKYLDENHSDCKNCTRQVALLNLTPEEFYLKYFETWKIIYPHKEYIDQRAQFSRAAIAKNDEILWIAYADFGHGSGNGVCLKQVYEENIKAVLFYFRMIKTIDLTLYQKICQDTEEERKKNIIINKQNFILKRAQDRADHSNKLLQIFSN